MEKIKEQEIHGYTDFVKHMHKDPSLKESVSETYLDKDVNKAAFNFGKSYSFNLLLKNLKIKGNEKVLDFGAGRGVASYNLAKLGCSVVALEMNQSEECGLGAIKNFKDLNFNAVVGDVENIPFKKGTFDIAYCHWVLHHAADLDKMVKEVASILKKGGILVSQSEPMLPPLIGKYTHTHHPAYFHGAHENPQTTFKYISSFRKAGLSNIHVESLLEKREILNSGSVKGKIMKPLLRVDLVYSIFKKMYAYLAPFENPVMIWGYKN